MFCYGQTGSGKTYTITAVSIRMVCDLFELSKSDSSSFVNFSAFQLVGNRIEDLLHPSNTHVRLLEDTSGTQHIQNIHSTTSFNAADLIKNVNHALKNRNSAPTVHEASSRTHAVLCFTLPNGGKILLIDLAGSERNKDSMNHDSKRIEESKQILSSLLALKNCLRAVRKREPRVPFRESKLTQVLKSSFLSEKALIAVVGTGECWYVQTIGSLSMYSHPMCQ